MFDITDVLAVVLLVFASLRRLDAKTAKQEDFPQVPSGAFEQWRTTATAAYGLMIQGCFAKVALNNAWYFIGRDRLDPRIVITGHWVIFIAWLVVLLVSWFRSTDARHLRAKYGIVRAPRGGPSAPATDDQPDRPVE